MSSICSSGRTRDVDCEERLLGILEKLYYGYGYDRHTMLDENRVYVENVATAFIAARMASEGDVVLLDGPVFNTPGLFIQLQRSSWTATERLVRGFYALVYYLLALSRVRIAGGAAGRGVEIVGFVKRLERSRLLARALGYGDVPDDKLADSLARKCGVTGVAIVGPVVTLVRLREVFDAILDSLGSLEAGLMLNPLLHIDDPAFILTSGDPLGSIESSPVKPKGSISIYPDGYETIVKRSYYIVGDSLPAVYRVELPCIPYTECVSIRDPEHPDPHVPRDVIDEDLELVSHLLWLAGQTTIGLPSPLYLADYYAKASTRLYAGIAFERLRLSGVRFRYESLYENLLAETDLVASA